MKKRSPRHAVVVTAVCCVIVCSTSARAQLFSNGSQLFGLPQLLTFGSVRLLGMGNLEVCVTDLCSRNPAHVCRYRQPEFQAYYGRFNFDAGPDLDEWFGRLTVPVGDETRKDALQFMASRVTSNTARIPLVETPPLTTTADAEDLFYALVYATELSPRLWVGFSGALDRKSETRLIFSDPLGLLPPPLTGGSGEVTVSSDAPLQAKGRVGVQYALSPRVDVASVYTFYDQDADYSADAFATTLLGPPNPPSGRYRVSDLDLGVAFKERSATLGFEYNTRRTTGPNFLRDDDGVNVGVEVNAGRGWLTRLGFSEGGLTLGLGYRSPSWQFDYAYAANREGDELKSIVGSSRGHFLALTRLF